MNRLHDRVRLVSANATNQNLSVLADLQFAHRVAVWFMSDGARTIRASAAALFTLFTLAIDEIARGGRVVLPSAKLEEQVPPAAVGTFDFESRDAVSSARFYARAVSTEVTPFRR